MSGWFGSRHHVALMVAGYPNNPDNRLRLELRTGSGDLRHLDYSGIDPGETWRPWMVEMPPDVVVFRIVAVDGATRLFGWLGVSQPFVPDWRLAPSTQALRSLLGVGIQGLLLTALALCSTRYLPRLGLPPWLVPAAAIACVAAAGYACFWAYFASPLLGRAVSWCLLAWAVAGLLTGREKDRLPDPGPDELAVAAMAAVIGIGVVALTCLFDATSFSFLAANRFLENMPSDNRIPGMFADRLWLGQSPRHLAGDWLSSDRPPLQSGWLLMTKPVLAAFGFDADTTASAGGVCFQLLWIPAAWALLRRLGARPRQAAAAIAAMGLTGFFLIFTAFTWPKLGAAALVLTAYLVWWPGANNASARPMGRFVFGGICAALGWLAHGGVGFSILGLVPLAACDAWKRPPRRKAWIAAALAFALLSLSWSAYQRFYEPPGNRLLKWHLAGSIAIDSRTFARALVEDYQHLGWQNALANRLANLRLLWSGDWHSLILPSRHWLADVHRHRADQCTYPGYVFGWWLPALFALPWMVMRSRDRFALRTVCWLMLGYAAQVALMFFPNVAIVHQGTLLTQMLGLALLTWSALAINRFLFLGLASVQAAVFLGSWVPMEGRPAGSEVSCVAVVMAGLAGAILAGVIIGGATQRGAAADPEVDPTE